MKITLITQARLGSSRLPEKILKKVKGKTILEFHLESIYKSKRVNEFIIATTHEKGIEAIEKVINHEKIKLFKGSTNDVLDRFYKAVKESKPDYIVRVTSDCPLIDPELIDLVIEYTIKNKYDYCSNCLIESYPDGQDIEVFSFKTLKTAWKNAKLKSEREHVTPYIIKNSTFHNGKLFKSNNFPCKENYNSIRMTVDQIEDLEAIKRIINTLGSGKSWIEYAKFIKENRRIFTNQNIIRNEGYIKSITNDI